MHMYPRPQNKGGQIFWRIFSYTIKPLDTSAPQQKCPHIGGVPSSEEYLHVKWQNMPQESVP